MSHSHPNRRRKLNEVVDGQFPSAAYPDRGYPYNPGQLPPGGGAEDDFMPVNSTRPRKGRRRSDDDEVLGIVRSLLSKIA